MKVFKFLSRLIPKFDLSKTEDKLKLFILVNGLVLFIGVFSVAALKLTSTPQFCAICHEMRPEYVTWAATSHNKVACVKCHIEPGIVNLIKHKMGAMKQLYQHVTKTYHRPIEMPHEIEDYICEQCHSQNRVVNASGDLIIPHEKHKIQEVPCVRCHSGVAHGKIAEREVTAEGDFSEWTLALGKKEAAPKYTRPAMKTCMTCHKERQVTTDCAACHKVIRLPENHQAKNWKQVHGLTARQDYRECMQCHSAGEYVSTSTSFPVKEFARNSEFCYSCHTQRPPNHKADWLPKHKGVAQEKGLQNCFVCHDINKPEKESHVTKTYCNMCHWFGENEFGGTPAGSSSQETGEEGSI